MDITDPHRIARPHFLDDQLRSGCEQLLALSAAAEPDIRAIAALTKKTSALNLRVLCAANASSHGLHHQVQSTEQAVALLGAKRLREIAAEILQNAQV